MRRKPKGRKIYKTKEKNYYGKSPMGKFLSAALTVLLIGGIGFIGYSAAEPLINFTQHKGDEPEPTEAPTEAYTPIDEDAPEETTEAPTEAAEPIPSVSLSAALKPTDLSSIETLRDALAAIPKTAGVAYVEVPLKQKGGYINYASTNYDIQAMGAIQYPVPLADILNEIVLNGYHPAAIISTYRDSLLPSIYYDAGYLGVYDGAQWYDYNDGSLWTTPYSERALNYLSGIIDEVTMYGFDRIICTDFVFPDFRESDLELLDEQLSRGDRCMAMTSAANVLYDRALANGASMLIEVSAADILRGRTDILQPMLLSSNSVILNIDLDELSLGVSDGMTMFEFSGTPEENAEKCMSFVSEGLSEFNVTIRLSGATKTYQELINAKEKLAEYGYSSFVIG